MVFGGGVAVETWAVVTIEAAANTRTAQSKIQIFVIVDLLLT